MARAQLLFVATLNGITILSNPGQTDRWLSVGQELAHESINIVGCESTNPMNAYAQTIDTRYQTQDGGQTWHASPHQTESPPVQHYVFPGNPPAQIRINQATATPERSSDDGLTWEPVLTDSGGSWAVLHGPQYHQDTLYAGTANGEIWFTTDRGKTWSLLKRDLPPIQDLAIGRVIS